MAKRKLLYRNQKRKKKTKYCLSKNKYKINKQSIATQWQRQRQPKTKQYNPNIIQCSMTEGRHSSCTSHTGNHQLIVVVFVCCCCCCCGMAVRKNHPHKCIMSASKTLFTRKQTINTIHDNNNIETNNVFDKTYKNTNNKLHSHQ